MINRRRFLAGSLSAVVALPGLRHGRTERDIFLIPLHAWHAIVGAAIIVLHREAQDVQ